MQNGGAQFQFWATLGANFEWTKYTSEDQKCREIHYVLFTGAVDSKNTRFLERPNNDNLPSLNNSLSGCREESAARKHNRSKIICMRQRLHLYIYMYRNGHLN